MHFNLGRRSIGLPAFVDRPLEQAFRSFIEPGAGQTFDFSKPEGEPALQPPNSVAWRIFKNPVALFAGGVAAVILELAEPRVRAGVWDHSTFRADPGLRLRRTGQAAMITVYGARKDAEAMIARVRGMHDSVKGVLEDGRGYYANDPELLTWVYATANFGFLSAYTAYVEELPQQDRDAFYLSAASGASLYGTSWNAASEADIRALFDEFYPQLEPSPVVHEFLAIMRDTAIMPRGFRALQRLMVRAAVSLLPEKIAALLSLSESGLRPGEALLVKRVGALADRLIIASSPPVQACLRLGLPFDYLYRRDAHSANHTKA